MTGGKFFCSGLLPVCHFSDRQNKIWSNPKGAYYQFETRPMSEVNEALVTAAQLAKFLGVTVGRINQLTREGVLTRNEKKFHLKSAVQAYCARLRETAAGRVTAMDGEEGAESFDPIQSGARLKTRQAEILEMKLAQARKEVISMEDAVAVMGDIVAIAKAKMLNLPATLQTQLHSLTAQEIGIIQREVKTILRELAQDADGAPEAIATLALSEESE
jgi:phage terminase Nu1 subunit (DNA packaging protein)